MKKNILLVDDDPLVLKSLQNLLLREGYAIDCAKTAAEAREKFQTKSFQLILCDIRMPGEDGITAIKKLREATKGGAESNVPCIFITGYASEEAPIEAVKLGAKDYLLKPFDLDELLASVRRHIA